MRARRRRGIIAEGELLAHVQKELGVAVAAEDEVCEHHRARVVRADAPAHR